MINISSIIKKYNFQIKNVWEVGVFSIQDCHIQEFIKGDYNCVLIEPHPANFLKLKNYYNTENVKVLDYVISDYCGPVSFYDKSASSFISGINSPSKVNDGYKENITDSIMLQAITFDKIDTGDIDLILIDIEGAEWFVLKNMISRPKIISVETHGGKYINPYIKEIEAWMKNNNYKQEAIYATDTVFIKT